MEATHENVDSFRHARWRVRFVEYLLEMHDTSPRKGGKEWYLEQAEYLNRLQMAEQTLARFPVHWEAQYGELEPITRVGTDEP